MVELNPKLEQVLKIKSKLSKYFELNQDDKVTFFLKFFFFSASMIFFYSKVDEYLDLLAKLNINTELLQVCFFF